MDDARRRGTRRASATQADVARHARVSTATVSRVLNGSPLVRAEVRARVEAAVVELGYVPNSAARALALNRTHTVGAVIPTLANAIFAQGVNAFETALRARGYTLILTVSNYDERVELTGVRRLIERGVDALMLVGTDHDPAVITSLSRAEVPFVCTWAYAPQRGLPTVGFDNHAAMGAVVDHLVSWKHRRIAMLAGIQKGNDRARDRVRGVVDALARHALRLRRGWLVDVPYSVDAASEAAERLLAASRARRPTAIVCGNDVIAYGVLFAAQALDIAVPTELSVVGFDDLALSARLPPGLTTVNVPAAAMGALAAHRLADRIEGAAEADAAASIELPTELVVRGSTGPASTTRKEREP